MSVVRTGPGTPGAEFGGPFRGAEGPGTESLNDVLFPSLFICNVNLVTKLFLRNLGGGHLVLVTLALTSVQTTFSSSLELRWVRELV